jgi:tRNA (guanine37-N1)-methyltransferase
VLDKLSHVKTVVNKLHEIDSVYRNFELEILAGEANTIVKCRESKATFQFDFAKVYWNPRLSNYISSTLIFSISIFSSGTERERIVNILHHNDLVFDVFAGVGPFVVPALMLGCTVYANDINPESVKWMTINLKSNQPKKSSNEYHVFNLDGREFLQTVVFPRIENYQKEIANDQEKRWCLSDSKIIILMNLPDIALTFLDVVSEWLSKIDQLILPIHIYCYTFSKADNREEDIRIRLKSILSNVNDDQITCRFVRQVAPNKDMMCVQIKLFDKKTNDDEIESIDKTNIEDENPAKRFKQDSSE